MRGAYGSGGDGNGSSKRMKVVEGMRRKERVDRDARASWGTAVLCPYKGFGDFGLTGDVRCGALFAEALRGIMRNFWRLRGFGIFVLAGGLVLMSVDAEAQDRGQTRSMVISKGGIVASESPLASQAGVRILENGGNAVDAAIATNAMMGVVEPMMNGIGGDLFVIVYDRKADKLYGLNASGWAPKGLTIEFLHQQGLRDMPQQGVHTITVPGAVDGWQNLADKFGRKKLAEDLTAAIRTAQDGFPVPEWAAGYWAAEVDYLRTDETTAKTYLPGDRAPKMGELFRNPELAWSLEQIAQHGREAFY